MNKTLADLLRLSIVLTLIVLAYQTLPTADPAQHTSTTAKQRLAAKPASRRDSKHTNQQQNKTGYYVQTSIRTRE